MNHDYIDRHDIAGQYLRNELAVPDREAFQAHLVDCAECADRVLLAEMFQGKPPADPDIVPMPRFTMTQTELPLRAKIAAHLSPLTIALLAGGAILVVIAVVGGWFWWELQDLRSR